MSPYLCHADVDCPPESPFCAIASVNLQGYAAAAYGVNSGNCFSIPPGPDNPCAQHDVYGSCGDALDAKPPNYGVPCGATMCTSPDDQCCQSDVDSGTSPGTYACVPRSSGPCASPANATIQCDGPEDCVPGTQCTVYPLNPISQHSLFAVFCSGQLEGEILCHTAADCPANAPHCWPAVGLPFAINGGYSTGTLGSYPISICSSADAGPPDASAMVDSSAERDGPLPDSAPVDLDSALPDSSDSPVETFEVVGNGSLLTPLSCPTSHWEFSVPPPVLPTGTIAIAVRNTGSVPLAYIAESSAYISGVVYTPGVPTGETGEEVGVLSAGATMTIVYSGAVIEPILVGSAKPFSTYDGGYAAADEWSVPWPAGVDGGAATPTMYVAQISWDTVCAPVSRQ
jgi:hypothetical protein